MGHLATSVPVLRDPRRPRSRQDRSPNYPDRRAPASPASTGMPSVPARSPRTPPRHAASAVITRIFRKVSGARVGKGRCKNLFIVRSPVPTLVRACGNAPDRACQVQKSSIPKSRLQVLILQYFVLRGRDPHPGARVFGTGIAKFSPAMTTQRHATKDFSSSRNGPLKALS
jgi:hypothetical protein